MFAEAENEVNGPSSLAKLALKEVRLRANATDITSSVPLYEDLKTAIRKERFLELSFESLRKFDLVRWDIFVSEMNQLGTAIQADGGATWSFGALAGKNVTSRNPLLPIPVLELSLNKGLSQNTGW
ncbi:SusD family protein [compost metagenome]